MKNIQYILTVTCIFTFINFFGQGVSDNSNQYQKDEFEDRINFLMDSIGIPAVSLGLISDGKIQFYKNFGIANSEEKQKLKTDAMFEACSLSKTFLAYKLFQLIEKCDLSLEDPISKYLPKSELQGSTFFEQITVGMLLNHTAGIENWKSNNDPDRLEIIEEPGTAFTYSGEGYRYLSLIIAEIEGSDYETYMSSLFDQLGLRNTTVKYSAKDKGDYVTGHNLFLEPLKKWNPDKAVPASSINTTAKDYAKFLLALFEKGELNNQSISEILKPQKEIFKDETSAYFAGNGFFLIENKNDTLVNFSGANTGFKADMLYSPKKRSGFILLTNSELGILLSPLVNEITSKLEADIWYDNPDFRELSQIAELSIIYRQSGIEELKNKIFELRESEYKDGVFTYLLYKLYEYNPKDAGLLADLIIKLWPNKPYPHVVLGKVEWREYSNLKAAESSFMRAKENNYQGKELEGFIQEIEKELNIKKNKI